MSTLKCTYIQQASSASPNITLDSSTNATVAGTLAMGHSFKRNKIINGDMRIDQRNAGASLTITNTSANTYTLDRWFAYGNNASKFSVQQNAGSITPPTGFTNYLGVTSLAATTVAAGDQYIIGQAIEGFNNADFAWGTANAKTVTLSFQVYSSLTGTFGGAIRNNATTRSYPFTYSISSANTWTPINIVISGETTGAWITNNGVGLYLYIGLGVGSTYLGTAGSWSSSTYTSATGATNIVGTNGATFYITGVQLETGSIATPYERQIYSDQLAQCQRYYYVAASGASVELSNGFYYSSTQLRGYIPFPIQMRATPSLVSTSGTNYYFLEQASTDYFNSFTIYQPSIYGTLIYNSTEASGTAGYAASLVTNNAASYVAFAAEL